MSGSTHMREITHIPNDFGDSFNALESHFDSLAGPIENRILGSCGRMQGDLIPDLAQSLGKEVEIGTDERDGIIDLVRDSRGKFANRGQSTGGHEPTPKHIDLTAVTQDHDGTHRLALLIEFHR